MTQKILGETLLLLNRTRQDLSQSVCFSGVGIGQPTAHGLDLARRVKTTGLLTFFEFQWNLARG